jgi:hypothetical protein
LTDYQLLEQIFSRHRIRDGLLELEGSGRQSQEQAQEQAQIDAKLAKSETKDHSVKSGSVSAFSQGFASVAGGLK